MKVAERIKSSILPWDIKIKMDHSILTRSDLVFVNKKIIYQTEAVSADLRIKLKETETLDKISKSCQRTE